MSAPGVVGTEWTPAASGRLEGVCGQLASCLESGRTASDQSPVGPGRSSSTPTPKPTVHKSGPSLKMFLLILLFLGLADACIPREGKPSSSCRLPLLRFFLPWAGARWLASVSLLGSKSRFLPAPSLEIPTSPFPWWRWKGGRVLGIMAPALGDT